MQSVFPIVVFGAVAFSVVMSIAFLLSRGSAYDEIGKGGLAPERDAGGGWHLPAPNSPAGRAERELEIRQMLGARSERLVIEILAPTLSAAFCQLQRSAFPRKAALWMW